MGTLKVAQRCYPILTCLVPTCVRLLHHFPLAYPCQCLAILHYCTCTLRPALHLGNPHFLSLEALARSVNANCLSLFSAARLFVQLVDLFQFYMMFPIDDHTGDPVSDEDVTAAHYEKVQQVGICTFMSA